MSSTMPPMIHGFSSAVKSDRQFAEETAPKSRMPRARKTSPHEAKMATASRTRYLRAVKYVLWSPVGQFENLSGGRARLQPCRTDDDGTGFSLVAAAKPPS